MTIFWNILLFKYLKELRAFSNKYPRDISVMLFHLKHYSDFIAKVKLKISLKNRMKIYNFFQN